MRTRSRILMLRQQDSGAGTVLVLALLAGLTSLTLAQIYVGSIVSAQVRIQSAVDLSAIGANQTFRGLNSGIPCARAKAILEANVAHLKTCSIVGDETTVAGSTSVVGIVLSATATAAGN